MKLEAQMSNVECRMSNVPARLFYLETKDHAAKFSPEMKTDSDHKRTTHHAPRALDVSESGIGGK